MNKTFIVVLIAFMNMIVPLSLDMYLPAVPHMTEAFSTTESMVNLTLVGFYFFMAIGMLVFGPLSDKYGRRRLLFAGSLVYAVFSVVCALSTSIWMLTFARVAEALGAGCMVAISTAMIKDCFDQKARSSILAVVQAMAVVAPMVAPIVGAFIVTHAGWRATFAVLGVFGALSTVAVLFVKETLAPQMRYEGTLLGSLGLLVTVGRNVNFSVYLLSAAMLAAPYMGYVAVCSYVYISFFGLSETQYSYYFAVNSAVAILGPLLYVKLTQRVTPRKLMHLCIVLALACGVALLLFGATMPVVFLLCFLPFTIVESALRPMSTAILLNQQEKDAGSASSLINFVHTVLGSVGMVLAPVIASSYIDGLGILLVVFSAIAGVLWLWVLARGKRSGQPLKGIEQLNK
ncbi:MAG: Bcr/CflA family efflux MFS transporter [Peptococcaceae bacterium]|nr:Bcr/CflA family efflux MFS transporter [Peptococcaceae bacterium]